jgi:hypothetical protein
MKSVLFFISLAFSFSALGDAVTNNEYEQYVQTSNEYNLKMAQIYKDLAFTGAEARVQKGLYCEEGTYTSDIVNAAVTAITRSGYVSSADAEKMSAKIRANKNIMTVAQSSFTFREATLSSTPYLDATYDIAKFQKVIVGTKFWGPGAGAYGSQTSVEFKTANQAEVGELEILDNEPWVKWNYKTVNYSIEASSSGNVLVIDGQRFFVQIDWATWSAGGSYIIIPEGAQPDENGFLWPTYIEYASECEA